MPLPQVTVTKLTFEPGYWSARVSVDGATIDVDRRHGSWQAVVRDAPGKRSFHRVEVVPALAALLQKKVGPREKQLRVKRGEAR